MASMLKQLMLPVHVALATLVSTWRPGELVGPDSATTPEPTIVVRGALIYRQRIALRPGGRAHIELRDVSRQDAPASVVAELSVELGDQQVPIDFELTVAAGQLDKRHRYAVRATITGPDGGLRWTTDTVHPVEPDTRDSDLGALTMIPVARPINQA